MSRWEADQARRRRKEQARGSALDRLNERQWEPIAEAIREAWARGDADEAIRLAARKVDAESH